MSVATAATADQLRRLTPVSAPPEQRRLVVALLDQLVHLAQRPDRAAPGPFGEVAPKCQLVGPDGTRTEIPEAIFCVLARVVEVMARGDSVTVVPVGRELTTQQAADNLNVSRQYLVRLLDEGRLPFRRTGKHRRLRIEDVLAFQQRRDAERRSDLRSLTELTEDVGGYGDEKPR